MSCRTATVVWKTAFCAVAFSTFLAAHSWAQECAAYVGTTVPQISIESALEQFGNMTPRSEFETSEEYELRTAASAGNTGPLVIIKPLNPERLVYEADQQVYRVSRYLFDNQNMPVDDLWSYGGPFYTSGSRQNTMYSIDVVVSTVDEVTGSYSGSNAYGASTTVAQVDRVYWGIFEQFASGFEESWLVPMSGGGDYIGEFPMPIAEARDFRDQANLAFVVVPNTPWRVNYRSASATRPTVRNPFQTTNVLNVLFGDIQCALIVDGSGEAVAAFETR